MKCDQMSKVSLSSAKAAKKSCRCIASDVAGLMPGEPRPFLRVACESRKSSIGVAPYAGLKFVSYEALKGCLAGLFGMREEELKPWQRLGSGLLAGMAAQTFVYPLDVVRRRMQTGIGGAYASTLDALTTIAQKEGIRNGLYRGLGLNYLKTMPNVAIYMSLYDIVKIQLGKWSAAK